MDKINKNKLSFNSARLLEWAEEYLPFKNLLRKSEIFLKKQNIKRDQIEDIIDTYHAYLNELAKPIKKNTSYNPHRSGRVVSELISFGLLAKIIGSEKRENKRLKNINAGYYDLMRMISHEFKNSLTSIHGYNRFLQKALSKYRSDDLLEITDNIDRLTGNLYGMVDSLYGLSIIDENALILNNRIFDIETEALMPILSEIDLRLKNKGFKVILRKNQEKNIFYGDEVLFQLIFRNLLLNAIQYGQSGTEIEININRNKSNYRISVLNYGDGLDQSQLEKIFDKFARFHTKKEKTNIGIGLYIVKRIVQFYNGTITAACNVNKTVEFIITIPFKEE
ncbi:MAG: HAMP domain-containing histidine kinase [Calditrichaceae bacterium]|nr:HAMP domain-containing histidine kinase [Calditrichaceae bacterium]MBN2709610.1 HAMP domain-containing histidine kinase [Calditrichaceae bacterium]RQV92407.1 MAG: sensor histidine kinase [Calditrichota bacterium]